MRCCAAILIILSASTAAFGAPFLVADPYPPGGEMPVKFLVTIDGRTTESVALRNTDGSVYLKFDLGDLPEGTHAVSVKAVDAQGNESPPGVCSVRKTGPKVEILNSPGSKDFPAEPMSKTGAVGFSRYGAGTRGRGTIIALICLSIIIPVCAILLNLTNFKYRLSKRRLKYVAAGSIILALAASSAYWLMSR